MKFNLKTIFKYSGYVAFGLFIFFFFTFLNFPYNKLKDRFFTQIEQQSGLAIDADELRTTMTLGIVLTGVTVTHRTLDIPTIHIDHLKVSPSLLSLMTLRPKIGFQMGLKQGELSGFFQAKGIQKQRFGLDMEEIQIKSDLIKQQTNLDISGLLNGDIEMEGNLQNIGSIEGTTQIRLNNFTIGKTAVMNMGIPEIKLSKVVLDGNLKQQKFTVQKLELGGPTEDLEASAKGDIAVNPRNLMGSNLNLTLQFKISKKLQDEFAMFLPFIANSLGPDGFYRIKITGSLSAPLANPQRS